MLDEYERNKCECKVWRIFGIYDTASTANKAQILFSNLLTEDRKNSILVWRKPPNFGKLAEGG